MYQIERKTNTTPRAIVAVIGQHMELSRKRGIR
jgi:hypothetical protein